MDVARRGFSVNETVSAVFQSACPRNSLKNGRAAASFLDVERLHETSGEWELVRTCSFRPHLSAVRCPCGAGTDPSLAQGPGAVNPGV